jgi:hypothetical protein
MNVFQMKLEGSNLWSSADGLEPTGSSSNYFIGNDPKQWRTDIPNYSRFRRKDVYDGIDVLFHTHNGELEYDFEVAPTADPRQIRLAFDGIDRMRVDPRSGDLLLTTAKGTIARQMRPRVYQQIGDRRVEVAGGYELLDRGQVAFALAGYDRRRALIIDPAITFTVLLQGESADIPVGIAVDPSGNSYIAGYTDSLRFPVVLRAPEPGWGFAHGWRDAFVTKLSPAGAILFSAYLGGSGFDQANGVAADSTGVYVTGTTTSKDFPLLFPFLSFPKGAYVTKISAAGDALLYSSYLGGSVYDAALAIAVDRSGAAYVTGQTESPDFPRVGPRPSSFSGESDGFLTKVDPSGDHLVYSGYLGGSRTDAGLAVAVDQKGIAYVGGQTNSPDLPVNPELSRFSYPGGGGTGFVLAMQPGGEAIRFLRYLGGGSPAGKFEEWVQAIAVDGNSNLYLVGQTTSSRFPVSSGGWLNSKASADGVYSGFVVKLDGAGEPIWGSFWDSAGGNFLLNSVAFNKAGDVYFGGWTSSALIPGISTSLAPNPTVGFIAKLTGDGHLFGYALRLGASVNGVAVYEQALRLGTVPPQLLCAGYQLTDGPKDTPDVFIVKIDEGVVAK